LTPDLSKPASSAAEGRGNSSSIADAENATAIDPAIVNPSITQLDVYGRCRSSADCAAA
jgi:hypothetical protein